MTTFAGLTVAGWAHLAFFGLAVPALAFHSRRQLDAMVELPPRREVMAGSLVQLMLFLAASLWVARAEGIALFPPRMPGPAALAAGPALLALACWAVGPTTRRSVARGDRSVHLFMPTDRVERGLWAGISLGAGVGEEVTWRGVQATLLARLMGDPVAAAVVASAMFGLGHAVQGWRGAAVTALFGLALHALVALDGTLYAAMAVHVAYDLAIGFRLARLGRELGYAPAAPAPAPHE